MGKRIQTVVHSYTEYYSAVKSNVPAILASSWKDPNGVLLTERPYSQRVTFYLYDVLVKTKLQIGSAVARFRRV